MVPEKLILITEKTIELLKIYPFVSPNFLLAVVFDYEVHVYECTGVEVCCIMYILKSTEHLCLRKILFALIKEFVKLSHIQIYH